MTRARHPLPKVLADHGLRVSKLIADHGARAQALAVVLAVRGYPASTGGGPRSSDTTSSTERAAIGGAPSDPSNGDRWRPGEWDGIDEHLAQLLHDRWHNDLAIEHLLAKILAHASDDDPIPAGTGSCRRCEKFCRPDADHPDNRIRSGYCQPCYRRWVRLGKPDRTTFERTDDETAA